MSVACTIGDIAWAEHFVKTQAHFLKAPLRAEAALLARATILFEKKQYRKVLVLLERQKFGATLDNIRARALLLKCCYELEHDDVLEKCIAFDVFLKKHSRHPAAKASRNFSDIMKAIVRRRLSDDKIRADIHNTKHLYFREWLLKKLEV